MKTPLFYIKFKEATTIRSYYYTQLLGRHYWNSNDILAVYECDPLFGSLESTFRVRYVCPTTFNPITNEGGRDGFEHRYLYWSEVLRFDSLPAYRPLIKVNLPTRPSNEAT